MAAKTLISALKAIPGVNIAASVLNAIIAGSIVAAIGEGAIYAFEKVYLGEKTVSDIDWVKKVIESKFSTQLVNNLTDMIENMGNEDNMDGTKKNIVKVLLSLFSKTEL